jgi:hypothetical protein
MNDRFPRPDPNDPNAAGEGWSEQRDAWYHSELLGDAKADEALARKQSENRRREMELLEDPSWRDLLPGEDLLDGVSEASIGGYFGLSYTVRWDDTRLLYHVSKGGYTVDIVTRSLTEADAARFWQSMSRIDVFGWVAEYHAADTVDGTSWSVLIDHEGRQVESGGSNACPRRFAAFRQAVSQLAGNRPFE